MKHPRSHLAEVQIQSTSDSPALLLTGSAAVHSFTVRLPQGAAVLVPKGFVRTN